MSTSRWYFDRAERHLFFSSSILVTPSIYPFVVWTFCTQPHTHIHTYAYINTYTHEKVVQKVIPAILLCWSVIAGICSTATFSFCLITEGNLAKWRLTWKCLPSRYVQLNSSTRGKNCIHCYSLLDYYGNQLQMWAPFGVGRHVSEVSTAICTKNHVKGWPAGLLTQKNEAHQANVWRWYV